jgi:heme-degrading monooxygenase HmoA
MILEIAYLTIDPARADEFEAAVAAAQPIFEKAKGFVSYSLGKVIEDPASYRVMVGWETVEAHTVDFWSSSGYQQWRALAWPFFVEPPRVEHVERII